MRFLAFVSARYNASTYPSLFFIGGVNVGRLQAVAVFGVLAALFVAPSAAQTTPASPTAARQITIIRAARLLDVHDGRVLAKNLKGDAAIG